MPEIARKLISLGTLERKGCEFKCSGGHIKMVKGCTIILKWYVKLDILWNLPVLAIVLVLFRVIMLCVESILSFVRSKHVIENVKIMEFMDKETHICSTNQSQSRDLEEMSINAATLVLLDTNASRWARLVSRPAQAEKIHILLECYFIPSICSVCHCFRQNTPSQTTTHHHKPPYTIFT